MASEEENSKGARTSAGMELYELVFFKDNVWVHPTQYANERIKGRLRLVKQGTSLFLTWIPYTNGGASKDESIVIPMGAGKGSEKGRNLYTIRAVSLSEMRSIRKHTPPFGWQYVIIVLTNGLAFPPLYFHSGGVREFLSVLREHAVLVKSSEDPNVYLVNDVQDPLQRSLTSLELTEGPVLGNESSKTNGDPWPLIPTPAGVSEGDDDHQTDSSVHSAQKPGDAVRDISIQVLEKFSLVTKFARDIFGDGRLHPSDNDVGLIPARMPAAPSQKVTWAKTQVADLDERTSGITLNEACEEVGQGQEVQVNGPDEVASTNVGSFELVDALQVEPPALVWGRARPPPLGAEEWTTFLDNEGRVVDEKALRKRIFYGGMEPSLRPEVWKFLLGYYSYASTFKEREMLVAKKREEYQTLQSQWQSVTEEQAKRFAKFRERKSRVEKDVVRTDRTLSFFEGDDNPNVLLLRNILITYSFYNFDLGYCQGMSDLLSPIVYVMEDESESFWCFASLMERLAPNFHRDQTGMHSQLLALSKLVQLLDAPLHSYFHQVDCLNYFFCFRWILIQFKREFEYQNVLRLWEVLWSRHLTEHFHIYMCVALLKRHRRKIMDEQMQFDTLLKFINELSGHIDLESTLRDAEALCIHAGEKGAACIAPGTPPSFPHVEKDV